MDFSALNPATSNPLNLASRNNDVNNVERLLQTLNPNCVDNRGWTCLHEAAHHDSYESIMLILKAPQIRARAETHEGHTALYLACKNNCSLKTIKALLDSAKNIANYGSTEGLTPLHLASAQGNVPLIELLLEYGSYINAQDFDGDTPLHLAVLSSEHEATITLLYAGADPEIKNTPKCFTPFHLACCKGYYPIVESLYPFVYDINEETKTGDTALHYAVRGAGINVVNFLLDHGADPNILNKQKELPIDVDRSDVEVFKRLFSVTDRKNLREDIIIDACLPHKFQFEILETLLYSDLEPDFYNLLTPYNILIDNGFLNSTEYTSLSPVNHFLTISAYVYEKSPEKFREFLYLFFMRGANVNIVDELECPPLVYAQSILHNSPQLLPIFKEVFDILVQIGCDVDFSSTGKICNGDVKFSDAFLTALDIYPSSAPIMMPYSLYNEPQDYLQFAIDTDRMFWVPIEVQKELLMMVDKNFTCTTALQICVPTLKHLCRYIIRRHFRKMTKKEGLPMEFNTSTFIRAFNALPLPAAVKNYLRYISY